LGLSIATDFGATKGLGNHDINTPASWLPSLHKAEYAFTLLYNPALMATKTSVLVFYLRITKSAHQILRIASYAVLAVVNIDGVVLFFLIAFQCNPVSSTYASNPQAKCLNIVTLYLCSAPVNIVANLAILVLPIPVLTGMHLPQRQKTVLVFTFSLGIFVTVIDVVRIYYLQQAADNQQNIADGAGLGTGIDFSWNASPALMWSAVEVNVGIVCACIPTLKPLFRKLLPSMVADLTENGSSTKTSHDTNHRFSVSPVQAHFQFHSDMSTITDFPPAHPGHGRSESMGIMDFLTTPVGNDELPRPLRRTQTQGTAGTARTAETTYFGFFVMKRPKSMLVTRGWECFQYCTLVTIIFLLWGFSYGLLNTLNNSISKVAHETRSQTLGLSAAYFGGYLFGPLTVGQWVLRHGGFKHTFITGLCIYGIATLMFWPSAVLKSFPGFFISNFVVGFSLSILETAANPFILLCGPAQYSEYRLLLAQGVQGIGTVLSQLVAQKALFRNVSKNPSLIDTQWTYLGIALFTVILALFFYYMPLPEAKDAHIQQLSENLHIFPNKKVKPFQLPLIWTTLSLAVFAQFVYVSAQESNSVWFVPLLRSLSENLTMAGNVYTLLGHSTFTIGRFVFAFLCLIIRPRILLLACFVLSTVSVICAMSVKFDANGVAGFILTFYFFQGPIFPLVFGIGLRGMGRHTKLAASLLTTGVSGGTAFAYVMYAVQQVNGKSIQYSYCVVVTLMAFGILFPIYLNCSSNARHQVDPAEASHFGIPQFEEEVHGQRRDSRFRRASVKLNSMLSKIGRNKRNSNVPVVEHRERISI
jgi:fucose permease